MTRTETIADRLCREWKSIVGTEHLHTAGGCPMHRAIATVAEKAAADHDRALYEERLEVARKAAERTDQEDGVKPGYMPACGVASRKIPGDDWHSMHKLDDGTRCWGYCDCTHAAKYAHSVGRHK